MIKRIVVTVLASVLMMAAGAWLFLRKPAPKPAAPQAPPALDATHEKLFLAEQLKRNSTHTPILLRLAQIERAEGDLSGARQHLEQAVAADGSQVDARLELGLVCWSLGDFAAAEEQNREVLKIDPGQPDALYNLGAIFANRGDSTRAIEQWTKAVRGGRDKDAVDKSRRAIEVLEAKR